MSEIRHSLQAMSIATSDGALNMRSDGNPFELHDDQGAAVLSWSRVPPGRKVHLSTRMNTAIGYWDPRSDEATNFLPTVLIANATTAGEIVVTGRRARQYLGWIHDPAGRKMSDAQGPVALPIPSGGSCELEMVS